MGKLIEFKPDCKKKLIEFTEQPECVDRIWQFHHHLYLSFVLLDDSAKIPPIQSLMTLLRTPLHDSVYQNDRSDQYKRYFLAKHLEIVMDRLNEMHLPKRHPSAETAGLVSDFLRVLRKVISRHAG